jgi:hypothetical protein
MKSLRFLLLATTMTLMLSSCSLWNKMFPPKYGCPSDGRNVGAEKLVSGDMSKKEMKKARKAKFRSN